MFPLVDDILLYIISLCQEQIRLPIRSTTPTEMLQCLSLVNKQLQRLTSVLIINYKLCPLLVDVKELIIAPDIKNEFILSRYIEKYLLNGHVNATTSRQLFTLENYMDITSVTILSNEVRFIESQHLKTLYTIISDPRSLFIWRTSEIDRTYNIGCLISEKILIIHTIIEYIAKDNSLTIICVNYNAILVDNLNRWLCTHAVRKLKIYIKNTFGGYEWVDMLFPNAELEILKNIEFLLPFAHLIST